MDYQELRNIALTAIQNREHSFTQDSDGNTIRSKFDDIEDIATLAANNALKCLYPVDAIEEMIKTIEANESRCLSKNRMTT